MITQDSIRTVSMVAVNGIPRGGQANLCEIRHTTRSLYRASLRVLRRLCEEFRALEVRRFGPLNSERENPRLL